MLAFADLGSKVAICDINTRLGEEVGNPFVMALRLMISSRN